MKKIGIALATAISLFVLTGCVEEDTQSRKPKAQKTLNQHKVYGNAIVKTFSVDPDEKDNPEKYLDDKVESYLNSIKNLEDYKVTVNATSYGDVKTFGNANFVRTDLTIIYTVTLVKNKEIRSIKDKLDEIDDSIDSHR